MLMRVYSLGIIHFSNKKLLLSVAQYHLFVNLIPSHNSYFHVNSAKGLHDVGFFQ